MRLVRLATALAVVIATTTSYGQLAYADDNTVAVTVRSGDTLSLIADTHNTAVSDLVSNNSISNPDQIEPGEVVQVPATAQAVVSFSDSLKAAAEAFMAPPPAPKPPVVVASAHVGAQTVRQASTPGNSYTWGTCTWYVKQQIPSLPNQLGNAGNWYYSAATYGYRTGLEPAPGAIGVEGGHVVIVSSVNGDGTVSVSEMNYGGGVGVVHYRTASAGSFKYIYM